MQFLVLAFMILVLVSCKDANQKPAATGSEPDLVVRLYYGLGGALFSGAIDRIAADARKKCGAQVYVASRHGLDKPPAAKKLVIGGASMGGRKAVLVAESLKPRKVDLLLTIDPVPWVGTVPPNVRRSVNWRGTLVGQLGRGKPHGVTSDRPFPWSYSHLAVIRSERVHREAVEEICRLRG